MSLIPSSLVGDILFAARILAKDRGFTVGALLVLGLGLGVNAPVFTIINGMNLRGLPVPRTEQIMPISSQELHGRRQGMFTSYADFRDRQASFCFC